MPSEAALLSHMHCGLSALQGFCSHTTTWPPLICSLETLCSLCMCFATDAMAEGVDLFFLLQVQIEQRLARSWLM